MNDWLPPTEFSEQFVAYMRHRMAVSFHKYGPVADAYPHKIDSLGSMQKRLENYAATGNMEWLVDAANFLMIEFMHPKHPAARFEATDSAASPGRVSNDGRQTWKANEEIPATAE